MLDRMRCAISAASSAAVLFAVPQAIFDQVVVVLSDPALGHLRFGAARANLNFSLLVKKRKVC